MKNKTVSIIMPAYNCEKYIGDSIDSVIKQTYKNWELIIVDDCSNDNTWSYINNNYSYHQKIKLFRNSSNQGVSYSRNFGLSVAKGQLVAFLDSDDLWDESKLEKQIEFHQKKKVTFSFTGCSYINEKSEKFKGTFKVPEFVSYKDLKNNNVISLSSVVLDIDVIRNYKLEHDHVHEDYLLWLKILKNNILAYGINEELLIYRISSSSKSGNKFRGIKMTFNTHKLLGDSNIKSLYFTLIHYQKSVVKYFKIFKG